MNTLQNILAKYSLAEKIGLLLLSMPTGFGKTYNVLEFIYQNYQQFQEDNRKIIFLTNLKKNLPHEDLKQRFVQDDQEKEYDNHVLFIDSNFDCIINNLLSVQNEINDNYKNSKNYGKLIENIKIFKNLPNIESDYRKFIKKEIEKYESQFRKSIQKSLENIKPKQARIKAIKNDPEYQWIGKLYPAVFTDEKTVLFMSIDKFCLKNSTLVEPSEFCYKTLAEKALIFIDEFDSTKSSILNQIISEKVSKKKDLINLFLNIHNHLQNTEFPEDLLKESQQREKLCSQNNKIIPLSQIVEELRKKSQKIFEDFSLKYNYKYQFNNTEKPKRNFLFYDYQTHHVLDRRFNLIINHNKEDKINYIKTMAYNHQDYAQQDKLSTLTGRIIGFIRYFQKGISFLAENYQNLKKEENIIFPLESAINTVLDNFKLDQETIKFLSDNIQQDYQPFISTEKEGINQLKSFYEIGFKYYDVVDDDNHDLNSKIYFYNYDRTPEIILEEVCKKAMVIGISATAHIDTNIGNYDLDYLRNSLKNSFYSLSEDEINQLRNEYEEITKGYDKVTIKTKFTDTEESEDEALEILKQIVDDNNETCSTTLLNKCDKKYFFCRYVRIIEAWHYFNKNEDCRAFICFLNKLPKSQDKELDLDILYQYFCFANNLDSVQKNIKLIQDKILIINSNNFDDKFKEFKDKLQQGKRVFIISTYQTLGAGVNLQYPIPNDYQTIKINDFESRNQMDINGVYLEKPTNLLTPLNSDKVKDEDFIKYLFQLEFLRENSALSVQQFKNKLDKAFHNYIGERYVKEKSEAKIDLYQTTAYIKYVNKVIIQALGRICRTNIKAPSIYILAHKSLKKYLNAVPLPQEIIPVKEYQELAKHCIKFDQKNMLNQQTLEAKNQAELKSHKSFRYIQSRLNSVWNDNYIKEWQSLREQVLRQPTIIHEKDCETKWDNIYVKLPESKNYYRFTQTGDYQNVEIFFEKSEGDYEVSETASRLPKLMKISGVKQHFIYNNWATKFPQSELIITPPVFNNIYRGALGEVSGKYILENYGDDINLLPLEEKEYERFDFKTQNGIYIDFKFWGGSFDKDEKTEVDKIRAKMAEINAEKVIIINILADDNNIPFQPKIVDDEKIIIIQFLCQNNQVNPKVLQYISEKINKI